jgi:hypothetical protein
MKLSDIKKYFYKDKQDEFVFMHLKEGYELLIDYQEYSYYIIFDDNTVQVRAPNDDCYEFAIDLPHVDTEINKHVVINKVTRKEVFRN